jgi:hypothetical protein
VHKKKLQDLVESLVTKLQEANPTFDPMIARTFIHQAILLRTEEILATAVPTRPAAE